MGPAASPEAWLAAPVAPEQAAERPPVRVEVVSRAGCHLCEATAARLAPMVERHGGHLVLLDVDADPRLAGYSDHVPVVLVDGLEVDRLLVDDARVERAITAR